MRRVHDIEVEHSLLGLPLFGCSGAAVLLAHGVAKLSMANERLEIVACHTKLDGKFNTFDTFAHRF